MARHRTQKPPPSSVSRRQSPAKDLIYGIHAVEAALLNQSRTIKSLHVTENARRRLLNAIEARGIAGETSTPRDLDRIAGPEARHQGAVLETAELPAPALADLASARLVVVLDQVSDPQNVGAVLRSAAAFGVDALIMTQRNSPPLTGALAKAASGGLEHVDVVRVTNLARALGQLAELGFNRIGLDGDAKETFEKQDFSGPLALVLGAEGKGLRRLTKENCDWICRLTTRGPLESLNVSNAAAIALHTATLNQV